MVTIEETSSCNHGKRTRKFWPENHDHDVAIAQNTPLSTHIFKLPNILTCEYRGVRVDSVTKIFIVLYCVVV